MTGGEEPVLMKFSAILINTVLGSVVN